MQKFNFYKYTPITATLFAVFLLVGCQPQVTTTNVNLNNANTNSNMNSTNSNTNTNANLSNSNIAASVPVETKEPEQYSAKVTLKFEAVGDVQNATLPTITANVARNGNDRRMEFVLPNAEKVVYLNKGTENFAIMPNRKQFAELNQESVGFEVRRMLMPEQIVNQVKNMKGVTKVGEENLNGRQVIKYSYNAVANTQTQAGKVETESFIFVDKETGLPLRSETFSQTETGANVQGYKGLRLVTEMTDIQPTADVSVFNVPTDYQKVDSEQVRAQVNLLFNVVATFLGQMMKSGQPVQSPTATPAM